MFNILWNESEDVTERLFKEVPSAIGKPLRELQGVSVTLALTEQGLSVSTVITHGTIKMAALETVAMKVRITFLRCVHNDTCIYEKADLLKPGSDWIPFESIQFRKYNKTQHLNLTFVDSAAR